MKLLDASLSLGKMEQLLEEELQKEENQIRVLGDLNLSYEDYKCLSLKFKGVKRYQGDLDIVKNYKLCLMTTWTFSLWYEKEEKEAYEKITRALLQIPQYFQRYFLTSCRSVFVENGLCQYNIQVQSFQDLCCLIFIHASIPNKKAQNLYHMWYETLIYSNLSSLEEMNMNSLLDYLDVLEETSMSSLLEYLNVFKGTSWNDHLGYTDERFQNKYYRELKERFDIVKRLFFDCYINDLSECDLLEKYSFTSRKIIESCVEWCQEWKHHLKRQIE